MTARAIWYIESHLGEELTLEAIGEAIGVTRFHLCRAFAGTMGEPPGAYARRRRLSEAAKALGRGAPDILAVALEAGYGSHEAFTRAFRQEFGLTPESARARGGVEKRLLQEAVAMEKNGTARLDAPRMEEGRELTLVGLNQRYGREGNAGIPSQWNRFLPHFGRIPGQVGMVAYGVVHGFDETGGYEYLCGVEVSGGGAAPEGLERVKIPARRYAVFRHRDHISGIQASWKEVWERGLAEAGCEAAEGAAFERYGEEFNGHTGLGGVELWVPVKG